MRKFKLRSFVALLAVLALTAAACGGDDEPSDAASSTGTTATGACATADTSAGDLLAQICDEGVIRVSTDPAYPPQSSLNPETNEYEGFDIDVATAIADKLGVKIEWETPNWEAITAGNWQDRWDMSVGSMTVTKERTEVLDFSPAYYYTPASIAVQEDSDVTTVDQLNGQTIGVCAGCTYDFFLQGTLNIPGYTFESPIDVDIKGYNTDSTAIQALVSGQVDGTMSATPTLEAAIKKGRPSGSSETRCSTSRSRSRSTRSRSWTRHRWWQPSQTSSTRCTRTGRSPTCRCSGTAPTSRSATRRSRTTRRSGDAWRRTRKGGRGSPAPRPAAFRPHGRHLPGQCPVPFRLKVGIVWAVIFLLLGFLFNAADFNTQFMRDRADYVVKGLVYTLTIAFFAIILAIVLALIGALGRLSQNPIAYGVSGFYTSFFRERRSSCSCS